MAERGEGGRDDVYEFPELMSKGRKFETITFNATMKLKFYPIFLENLVCSEDYVQIQPLSPVI